MSALTLTRLTVQHAPTPLGVDVRRPRFSWVATSTGRDERQSAYQIVVASRPELVPYAPDVWDSGPVASGWPHDIRYGGPALDSTRRYWWAVRVADAAGSLSAWSETSWWEMALLDESDWRARWIGYPAPDSVLPLRYAERDEPVRLSPGHTLGQSFAADAPATSVSVCLMSWGASGLRCTATLRRDGPDGAVLARDEVDRIGDFFSWWLHLDEPLEPGTYYLELSASTGDIGWWSHHKATVPGGLSYADGVVVPGGRMLSVETTTRPAPLLRAEFVVPEDIVRARLYGTGLGYHELYLNGSKVGPAVLDPATTNYRRRVLYSCYDVTELLRPGRNALGAVLGRGFYGVRQASVWAWNSAPWAGEPRLLCQLELTHPDGSVSRVVSDEQWKVADGPTRSDATYCGDVYDAQAEPVGWPEPGFDDSGWANAATLPAPTGTLRVQAMPPITPSGAMEPVEVVTRPDGSKVFDFGRATAGWARMRVNGEAGTEVTLRYGEKLHKSGVVNTDNWHVDGATQVDRYIMAGSASWEPRFSYKGFRYVQAESSRPVTVHVSAVPVHNSVPPAGQFTSSNELLNWIDRATGDTILNNLHGIPTDTPFFEKNGWTGDAHLIAESAMHRFDMQLFFRKWLNDLRDAQLPDGGIPVIAPTPGWGEFTDPSWSSAYPLIAWNLYEFYGDADVLAEHYEPMRRYIERIRDTCRSAGWLWPAFSHGDWLAPGHELPPEGPKIAGTAFTYHAAQRMSAIAGVLGRAADSDRYAAFAADVAQAFNQEFLDKDSAVYATDIEAGYRQASNVLPLAFGLVPPDFVDPVVANLVRDVREVHNGHLNTGALATKYLLPVLSAHGQAELALTVALQDTHPSWGFWRAQGAQTLWEAWDADARSHDHFFLGTATQWLHQHLAGLRPTGPGWSEFEVRPVCLTDTRVTRASARYTSVRGDVAVAWQRAADEVEVALTVPVGTRAEVHLPGPISGDVLAEGGQVSVGSGTYRLVSALGALAD